MRRIDPRTLNIVLSLLVFIGFLSYSLLLRQPAPLPETPAPALPQPSALPRPAPGQARAPDITGLERALAETAEGRWIDWEVGYDGARNTVEVTLLMSRVSSPEVRRYQAELVRSLAERFAPDQVCVSSVYVDGKLSYRSRSP